jgi:hypothetical protein
LNHLLHRLFVGHVGDKGKCLATYRADVSGAILCRARIDVSENKLGAFTSIAKGDGATDSSAAA